MKHSVYETPRQTIDLRGTCFEGSVLDIGGGGEGIISRVAGDVVVAVDNRKDELEETPGIGLKVIADARALPFLDGSFANVTFFYSLLYMGGETARAALAEAYRVLAPGGMLWIWDAVIPGTVTADIFVAQLEILLPGGEKRTPGYGVTWKQLQTPDSIRGLCAEAGFIKMEYSMEGSAFVLCAVK